MQQRSGGAALTPIPPPPSNKWRLARAAEAVRDGAISMLCLTAATAAARSMYIGGATWAHRVHRRLPPFSGLAAEEELPFLLPSSVRPPWLPPPSADGVE